MLKGQNMRRMNYIYASLIAHPRKCDEALSDDLR